VSLCVFLRAPLTWLTLLVQRWVKLLLPSLIGCVTSEAAADPSKIDCATHELLLEAGNFYIPK
jgi:hypothetical protein